MRPPDWRVTMVEMVRGAIPLDGAWYAGSARVPPIEQIGIYRNQYALRLYDALLTEVPGVKHLLSVDGALPDTAEALLRAYLADCPSRSWTLNRVADRLSGWLEARGADVALVDMARLDHAVMSGFEAAEPVPLDLAALGDDPVLRLSPPVRPLRLRTTVHDVRSAVLSERPAPEVTRADVPLVVYRKGIVMRHVVLEPAAWDLLTRFTAPTALGAALDDAVAAGADPAVLSARLGDWFRVFAERRLLQTA